MSDISRAVETAAALAESLAKAYAATGKDVAALFAAYVGIVVHLDEQVGRDALTALDRFVSGDRHCLETVPGDTTS